MPDFALLESRLPTCFAITYQTIGRFFDTIATFIQNVADWVVLTGKNMAQISNGISNPVVAGIIYWLIRMLVCGGCLMGAGILLAFIGIRWYVKGWRETRGYH